MSIGRIFSTIKNFIQKYFKVIIPTILILLVILITLLTLFVFRPARYVRIVNMGSRSAGVAWVSQKKTSGCMIAINPKNIFKSKKACDDGRKNLHLISIKGLSPDTNYKLLYIHGTRIKYHHKLRFQTNTERTEQPPFPNPGYGSVINQHESPEVGALVIITPHTNENIYPVAAITNIDGNYAVDFEEISRKSDQITLEAIGSNLTWNERYLSSNIHTPIPFIKVRSVD